MDTRTYILTLLEERIGTRYEAPTYYPKRCSAKKTFLQKSYSHWAANEFLLYLKSRNNLLVAAEQFIKLMDTFSCKGKDSDWAFSVAHDVAEDLLDYIYTL